MADVGLIKSLIEAAASDKGITFISQSESDTLSYASLYEYARRLAVIFQEKGAKPGELIVLQCDNCRNFVVAFWACLLGGYISIPLDVNRIQPMHRTDVSSLGSRFIVYDKSSGLDKEQLDEGMISVCICDYDLTKEPSKNTVLSEICHQNPDENIVYIMYSSGSTGERTGIITHEKTIFADILGIIERLRMDKSDVSLTWQPLTHCYGLVAMHLLPVVLGIDQYIMKTEEFMMSPLFWAEAATLYGATRLGTIPFAMKHFVRAYRRSKGSFDWDLSGVKSILTGAEQITLSLCNELESILLEYGLKKNTVTPLYGLAETVTIAALHTPGETVCEHMISRSDIEIGKSVSTKSVDADNALSVGFLEIGRPVSGTEICITDDDAQILPEETLGNICIRGAVVASNYYKNPNHKNTFGLQDGWINTGDIGFLKNGALTVVGRVKELVVINGKNYSCIDIENEVSHMVMTEGCTQFVVCGGLDPQSQQEVAVVFVECDENIMVSTTFAEIETSVKSTVLDKFGIMLQSVVGVKAIPKTSSGKTKRIELMSRYFKGEFDYEQLREKQGQSGERIFMYNEGEITKKVVEIVEEMFGGTVSDENVLFRDYGVISINIPPFFDRLNETFGIKLAPSLMFSYPSIKQLSAYIAFQLASSRNAKEIAPDTGNDCAVAAAEMFKNDLDSRVAIVGLSCRMPGGGNTLDEFWQMLVSGQNGISEVPESRWDLQKYYDAGDDTPGKMYCKRGGFLNVPIDEFDARLFNISPNEAKALDPQQRLLLELTWEAFENGHLRITDYSGSDTGVYVGMSTDEYAMAHIYSGDLSRIDAYSLTGMCASTACGRISYTFGFEGECFAVDTACSSTLTALASACNALKNSSISMGVVAGVNLMVTPSINISFSKLRATSKDGYSKAFDESANGYVRAEGCGVILVKRLSDALADGDHIYGVIRSAVMNQDGRSNGLTAPNGESQAKLIKRALRTSGLKPTDISYVETHGTGTKLGDPIEVNAIIDTYCDGRKEEDTLLIGSVKSNVGHLESAAGIASVAKVLLSMKNNEIPGNLHFKNPNPYINWGDAHIKVVSSNTEWRRKQKPRIAAINGFGFGGSNAHVIIEEAPCLCKSSHDQGDAIDYVLKLSAKTEASLKAYIESYVRRIENCADSDFSTLLYQSNKSKVEFEYRFAVTAASREEMIAKMRAYLEGDEVKGVFCNLDSELSRNLRKPVFMFTGQGSQYKNMGRFLFDNNEVFRDAMKECDSLFKSYLLESIIDMLYDDSDNSEQINKTVNAQPLIFAIEYSLYRLWDSVGIKPEIVMGHSIGEYAAAVAANIISLEDAAKLVSVRGRLMDSAPGKGSMGSVFTTSDRVREIIEEFGDNISIAAINGRETCVISGVAEDVQKTLDKAKNMGIEVKPLRVSHGFHSKLMQPVVGKFRAIAKDIQFNTPDVRFVSALYAREIDCEEVLDADYWAEHIVEKVDFYGAVQSIKDSEQYVFLEVGTNMVLSALCRLTYGTSRAIAGSLSVKGKDKTVFAESISALYVFGADLDWSKVYFAGKTREELIDLPLYPYDKHRFWMEPLYDCGGAGQQSSDADANFLIGEKIESPFMANRVIYQSDFTRETPFFMQEHIIFETPISPAAAHVSMLLTAAKELWNPASCTLKDIELRTPLTIFGDEERKVQVSIEEGTQNKTKFSIVSRSNAENSKWKTHTQGDISWGDKKINCRTEFDRELFEKTVLDVDIDDNLYGPMHSTGFDLGDSFRLVTKYKLRDDRHIFLIEPIAGIPDFGRYELYPGTIDSLFQTSICVFYKLFYAAVLENTPDIGQKTVIPYYIGQIDYNYVPSEKLWCLVETRFDEGILYATVEAYNEAGELVIYIKDFMAQFTHKDTLLQELRTNYNDMYYHDIWVNNNLRGSAEDDKNDTMYAVFGMDNSDADKVVRLLSGAGKKSVNLSTDAAGLEYINDPFSINDWSEATLKLVDQCSDKLKYVFITSEHCDPDENLKVLFGLIKGIIATDKQNRCSIKIITQNLQPIHDSTSSGSNQSTVWGYAKVLGIEHTRLFDGIIDTDSLENNSVLVDEITVRSDEEIALRSDEGTRFVSRLVNHESYKKVNKDVNVPVEMKADGVYLITGGTGMLGLVYAEYLIDAGAKNIALLCRREPSAKVAEQIAALCVNGVSVKPVYADICDRKNLGQVIANLYNEYGAVRGVIHAAGILNDKMIADCTWEDVQSVLAPKVEGVRNLAETLRLPELDFIIMLSSITAAVGNIGQGNYAAANYYLNSFARRLQSAGVKAYAINWGPWDNGGMASGKNDVDANMSALGIRKFSVETGKSIIGEFMNNLSASFIAVDIDWDKFVDNGDMSTRRNYLKEVAQKKDDQANVNSEQGTSDFVSRLSEAEPEERYDLLSTKLQSLCAKIIGNVDGMLPDVDLTFKEQGADSLMMFSIRSSINKLLNLDIEVSTIFNYPTISRLSKYLLQCMFEDEETESDDNDTDLASADGILDELKKLAD